jgi:hypothetical protein
VTGSGQPSWPAPPTLAQPRHGPPPRESAVALRLGLLGQSLLLALASTAGACLAAAWSCALSVIGLGAGIPLTLVATVLVRWFAGLHRRWAAARLGVPVAVPYRSAPAAGWLPRTWLARTGTILRDPATWRDGAWLLLNSVTALLTCGLSAIFFLLGVLDAKGDGDALVGRGGLAVDAVGVDLAQDGDAVPGATDDLSGGHPGVQPQRDGGVPQIIRTPAERQRRRSTPSASRSAYGRA